ncbi:MAG TPA: hypothetical protein VFC82_03485, partial [Actinomycetaceae bacterium]|nr:hypothetical protein [Actinomycetaceae bacterium]
MSDATQRDDVEFGANEWLIEELYDKYLQDPASVDPHWQEFFRDYDVDDAPVTEATPPSTAQNPTVATK